ncbi:MAG: SRPBCC family protein [Chitinophagales bacterium]
MVTWRAKHFGIFQKLTVKITSFNYPGFFEDTLIKGVFKSMRHEHRFEKRGESTLLYDHFEFEALLGILGKLAERWFLGSYLKEFLEERNRLIKQTAESSDWKQVVS